MALTALLGLFFACEARPMRSRLSAEEVQAAREACAFDAGTSAVETVSRTDAIGEDIPIDAVVILMFENRSFDHLWADLGDAGQTGADIAPPEASNPDVLGKPVPRFHLADLCTDDPDHSWAAQHASWDGGANDGFVVNHLGAPSDPNGHDVMGYYTAADLPVFHSLASTWAIADRYFCSVLGPTFPNRYFLYAATSFGLTDNFPQNQPVNNLMEAMSKSGISWRIYSEDLPAAALLLYTYQRHTALFSDLPSFYAAADAGRLPEVSFLDPALGSEYGGGDDLHPPDDVQNGDAFLAKIVAALTASPQWPRLALFVTFDENGGFYDHVPPPPACIPDDSPVLYGASGPRVPFDRLGFRVPLLVISPWARPHYVSHRVYDHTSIVRFVEARFGVPALSRRDANADPMLDLFDFSKPAMLNPPAVPRANVDAAKLAACIARYPSGPFFGGQ